MSDPVPLTDEELSKMAEMLEGRVIPNDWTMARLIADLRASRAEHANALDLAESLRRNLVAAGDELERLKERLVDKEKELRLAWRIADTAKGVSRPLP